jgi:hypothetical protein
MLFGKLNQTIEIIDTLIHRMLKQQFSLRLDVFLQGFNEII